jgi:hypothetical protein
MIIKTLYQELLGEMEVLSSSIINGTFGSKTSWIVSNESFMDNQNVFSFLKLKASFVLPENKVGW